MTPTEYIAEAMRTAKRMPTPEADCAHAALGLITEVGKLAAEVKRALIHGKPLDIGHIGEEIGDVLRYWALASRTIGLTAAEDAFTRTSEGVAFDSATLMRHTLKLANAAGGVASAAESEMRDAYVLATEITLIRLRRFTQSVGLNLATLATQNIAKLRLRYPEAYTDQAAEARADKNGLDARTS